MKFGEPNQICSNTNNGCSSGVGRFSNRLKLKKIPQRGLGVAQLEKIRIEELQKRDSSDSSLTSPPPIVSPTHSSTLTLPLLNHPSSQSSSSTPNFSSPPSTQPHTMVDTFYLNSVPSLNHFNGWPSMPRLDDTAHLSRMWDDHNSQWENGLLLPNNFTVPFQTNNIVPLPNVITHEPQFLQLSDSLLMEHPSNRSLYSNLPSIWVEEEKMSSAKRPYPFSFDTPSLPSFQNKFQKIVNTSNESTQYGNSSFFNYDHDGSTTLQETCLLSSSNFNKKTRNQNGEFLPLGRVSVSSPHPNLIWRDSLQHKTVENPIDRSPRSSSLKHKRIENLVDSARLESIDKNIDNLATNSGLSQYKPLFSFFPTLRVQHETSTMNIFCNSEDDGEVGGIVDLNLKL